MTVVQNLTAQAPGGPSASTPRSEEWAPTNRDHHYWDYRAARWVRTGPATGTGQDSAVQA